MQRKTTSRGGIDDLRAFETELCEHLGFGRKESFVHQTYETIAVRYSTCDITSREELRIADDFGPVFFLEQFPVRTSPFWNMRTDGEYARKIDVIILSR